MDFLFRFVVFQRVAHEVLEMNYEKLSQSWSESGNDKMEQTRKKREKIRKLK